MTVFNVPYIIPSRRVYKYKTIEFWPERGRIIVVDYKKAEEGQPTHKVVHSVHPTIFLKRAIALAIFGEGQPPEDRRQIMRVFEQAQAAVREAIRTAPDDDPLKIALHREAVRRMLGPYQPKALWIPKNAQEKAKWVLVPKVPKDQLEKTLVYGYELKEASAPKTPSESSTSQESSASSSTN